MFVLVLKAFFKLKTLYRHFLKHKCLTDKSTIIALSVQLNPAVAYLKYQLPTRLSGVLSYYNKIAEQKIPAVLSNFALPEDLKGVFKANCKHCYKTISGSTKVSTKWLKHMVSPSI